MDTSDVQNLAKIETMLEEFYGPLCSNERRKQIDDTLSSFFEDPHCLRQAIFFLSASSQDYTKSFALNVLQACVCHNWLKYSDGDKLQMRYYTRKFLLENSDSLQYYVINKLCKLIACIARNEWPETDPEYFDFVTGLINLPSTKMTGLVLLRATFEEFMTSRDVMSVSRKKTISSLLNDAVPSVLHFLIANLSECESMKQERSGKSIATECLQIISHMLSWMSLKNNISDELVTALMSYSQMPSISNSSQPLVDDSLQLLAMDCVNEIMAKKCVPKDSEHFLVSVFNHTMMLLTSSNQYTDTFLSKLVYFLQLMISSQYSRLSSVKGFPTELFLGTLLEFTFKQTNVEIYLSCLDVWNEFLEYLKAALRENQTEELSTIYRRTVIDLNKNVFRKVLFASNHSVLDEMDDENLDDDEETEYEKFQRLNLDIVVNTCDIFPADLVNELHSMFGTLIGDFTSLISCVTAMDGESSFELIIRAEYDNMRLHCKLRDLATVSRLVGMVNSCFLGCGPLYGPENENIANRFVSGLLMVCRESIKFNLFEIQGSGISETLHSDFSNLLALSLGSLQLLSHWISSFLGQAIKLDNREAISTVHGWTNDCFWISSRLIGGFNSKRVVFLRLAIHIAYSHASTIRASFLLDIPAVQDYLSSTLSEEFKQLPLEVQCKCVQAATLIILSSWAFQDHRSERAPRNWESRAPMFRSWAEELFREFHSVARNPTLNRNEQEIARRGLEFLSGIFQCLTTEVRRAREICVESLQCYLDDVVSLCTTHFNNVELCGSIVDVFHSVLDSVKAQLGPEKCTMVIDTLISQLTPSRVQAIFGKSSSDVEVSIISKFIKTLMRIVEEPGARFGMFIPSIVCFITDTISPLICHDNYYSPDCITIFLDLVFQVVNLHWNKFLDENSKLPSSHMIELLRIFGNCLLFPDLNVYKHALNGLQRLNEVHKLYENELFKKSLFVAFMKLLMSSLIEKSQSLNQDEIIATLHSMASVDNNTFFTHVLPSCLNDTISYAAESHKQDLVENFSRETDLPTFTTSLKQFINDIMYVKSLNASSNEVAANFTSLTQ